MTSPAPAGRSRTTYAILGFLAAGPKTGYGIRQAIAGSTAFFWNESFGQIYPMLRKLAEEGLVKPVKTASVGARARQRYAITPKGRAVLEEWIRAPALAGVTRNEMLLKLFFGGLVPEAVSAAHLGAAHARATALLAEFEERRADIAAVREVDPKSAKFYEATLDYGVAVEKAVLAWAEKMLAALGDEPKTRAKR